MSGIFFFMFKLSVFRADFWAYAAQLAVDTAIDNNNADCTFLSCMVSRHFEHS